MAGFTPLPVRLRNGDRAALTEHFLALDADDRRLRFGVPLSDAAVRALDERIDFERDEIFGVFGDDMRLTAVVHVAFYPRKAELGLSVLPGARGLGLGNALFARAVMHLTNRGVREVFVHCLSQNGAMMHLARKNGMRVVYDGSETDAYLALPRSTPGSVLSEWVWDQNARFAHDMRRGTRVVLDALAVMRARPAR
jgi:GNAT superfamily N-acetyltransferase